MPVKTHLANAARRRFYYVAATAQPSITPAQFFDAGYTPSTSPRLVNTAQITLHGQQPSNGPNAGPGQQSKGSGGGGQQTTGTLVLPIPGAGEGAPLGGGASGRSTGAEGYGGAAGSLLVPSPGNFSPPSFFPSILGSSERTQGQRSATFRLESGAYGIPKNRPRPQAQATSTPGASTSTAASPSTTPPPPQPPREVLDLSCQIGDDAYFVRSNALGVADGVGGWAARPGGNSALFSRRLMHHCSHELALLYPQLPPTSSSPQSTSPSSTSTSSSSSQPTPTPTHTPTLLTPAAVLAPLLPASPASQIDIDPVDILQRAYERTLELCRADGTLGSSTALLALLLSPSATPSLSPSSSSASSSSSSLASPITPALSASSVPSSSPRLRIAHVGDCLIGVIRGHDLIYRSSEQQHRFNYPYQLGPSSPTTPQKDAFTIDLAVQEGDIIVLATDGLGDNLWDEDVLEEARRWGRDVRGMSEALARRAKGVSEAGKGANGGETPFSRRATQEGKGYQGGKADDISVLVAVIEGCPVPEGLVQPTAAYTPTPMPGPFFRRY